MLAPPEGSTGRALYSGALRGGAQAGGRDQGAIRVGAWADLLALDTGSVVLEGRQGDAILDSWIFAGDDRLVSDLWSAGRHIVTGGRHVARDRIEPRGRAVLARLAGLL
jgi:formimidoylglutamate deiminase